MTGEVIKTMFTSYKAWIFLRDRERERENPYTSMATVTTNSIFGKLQIACSVNRWQKRIQSCHTEEETTHRNC
jgi:hypothetical protein